jgi:hypothetical protein
VRALLDDDVTHFLPHHVRVPCTGNTHSHLRRTLDNRTNGRWGRHLVVASLFFFIFGPFSIV